MQPLAAVVMKWPTVSRACSTSYGVPPAEDTSKWKKSNKPEHTDCLPINTVAYNSACVCAIPHKCRRTLWSRTNISIYLDRLYWVFDIGSSSSFALCALIKLGTTCYKRQTEITSKLDRVFGKVQRRLCLTHCVGKKNDGNFHLIK